METPKKSVFGNFCDIDLFGKDVAIYYKGKSQRNSWIGRILTLLYIGIYLSFFLFRIIRMINKDYVSYYDAYASNGEPLFIQLNQEIFNFGMALINPFTGMPYVDPSIYNAKIFYISGGLNIEYTGTELPVETCNINQFGRDYRDYFSKKDLNNLYCIKYYNQSLQRHSISDISSYFYILFFPCVNTSENNNMCSPKTNITKLLTEFEITLAVQDIFLTPKDYKKPVKPLPRELYIFRSEIWFICGCKFLLSSC